MFLRLPSLSTLPSWPLLAALLFVLANLKTIPLAWHLRLVWHLARNFKRPDHARTILSRRTPHSTTHPIFRPVSMFSRSPLLEADYNLHKSNSSYFTDLDISRTGLVTSLLSSGLRKGEKALEEKGHKGGLGVPLASVHTSFHREIRPYEKYEVRSRILGWDKKWIIIGSWFIGKDKKSQQPIVCASSLSKYVIKKGRYTIPPEDCFTAAGWLPEKPQEVTRNEGSGRAAEAEPEAEPEDSGIMLERPGDRSREEYVQRLAQVRQNLAHVETSSTIPPNAPPKSDESPATVSPAHASVVTFLASQVSDTDNPKSIYKSPDNGKSKDPPTWDWYQIDEERRHGLALASNWMALDQELLQEAARV